MVAGMSRRDYDVEAATEAIRSDDASFLPTPIPSSFTAINRQPTQLATPESSAAPIQQNQARRRAPCVRRRHNPSVAQYLGFGSKNEHVHLARYVFPSSLPESSDSTPAPKRQRLVPDGITPAHKRIDKENKHISNQSQLGESPRPSQIGYQSTGVKSTTSRSSIATMLGSPLRDSDLQTCFSNDTIFGNSNQALTLDTAHVRTEKESPVVDRSTAKQPQMTGELPDLHSSPLLTVKCNVDDSASLTIDSRRHRLRRSSAFDEEKFSDDIDDHDLLILMSDIDDKSLDSTNKGSHVSLIADDLNDDYGPGAFLMTPTNSKLNSNIHSSGGLSKAFVSPVTQTAHLLVADRDKDSGNARKPIVRPPFPAPVRDRSPIIGLSSNKALRTCFRIGEAINQSYQALKSDKHILVELYARILDSERTDKNQLFTFCDLFHAKPPYIKAAYDAALWKSVPLFEYDSRRLLQQGRMCRCIGMMRRKEKEWMMIVLNIWEATWDDINWIEGIVSS